MKRERSADEETVLKRIRRDDSALAPDPAHPNAVPPPAAVIAPPHDPRGWNVDQVVHWAMQVVKLDADDAQKLRTQKITGESLPEMTQEALERCGIPVGPSALLMKAIRSIFPPPATF